MSKKKYLEFPDKIIKVTGVKVPSEWEVEEFDDYMPVENFARPGKLSNGQKKTMSGIITTYQCMPVHIALHMELQSLLSATAAKGLLEEGEIELIELGLNNKGKHTEQYKAVIKGFLLISAYESYEVQYQEYRTTQYTSSGAPKTDGWNFLDQKLLN